MNHKRLIVCLLIVAFFYAIEAKSFPVFYLFHSDNTTGAGSTVHIRDQKFTTISCQVNILNSTGVKITNAAAVTVTVEGSLCTPPCTPNQTAIFNTLATEVLTSDQLTAGTAYFSIVNARATDIRGNITTLTSGGTTPYIDLICGGE